MGLTIPGLIKGAEGVVSGAAKDVEHVLAPKPVAPPPPRTPTVTAPTGASFMQRLGATAMRAMNPMIAPVEPFIDPVTSLLKKGVQNPVGTAETVGKDAMKVPMAGINFEKGLSKATTKAVGNTIAGATEGVLGNGSAGEVMAPGSTPGNMKINPAKSGKDQSIPSQAVGAVSSRLLLGAPGEDTVGGGASKVAGKLLGKGEKVVGNIAKTAHNVGSYSAVNQQQNDTKNVGKDIVNTGKAYVSGAAQGVVLGTAGEGLKGGAEIAKPVRTATKANLLTQLAKNAPDKAPEAPAPKTAPTSTPVPPKVQAAVNKLNDFYKAPAPGGKTADEILANRNAQVQLGQMHAHNLGNAIKSELNPNQLAQLDQLREGATLPNVDPKVAAIHNATLPLSKASLDTRLSINPGMGTVEGHNARLPTSISGDFKGAPKQTKSVLDLNGTQSFSDTQNLTSRFGFSRTIGAFADKNGNKLFGSPSNLYADGNKVDTTLTQDPKTGAYVGSDGKTYTPVAHTKQDITQGTGGAVKYETNPAKVDVAYHADTTSLKARGDAVRALQASKEVVPINMDSTGNIDANSVPKGYKVLGDDTGLGGYAAKRGTAAQIERQLGYKDPQSFAAGAFRKSTMGVVNWIVKNPIFHGANQAAQSFIAAGKTPLFKGGRLQSGPIGSVRLIGKLAQNLVSRDKDASVIHYLEKGGHTPTFNKDGTTILSRLHLPGLSHLPAKAMYHIELHLRAGLSDLADKQGMDEKAGVDNIDHYLGDSKAMSQLANDTLIFSHYMKTMGGAIAGHIIHPVAEGGATVNALALFALYAAANKGWQAFTGNKDASLRAPGEIGLATQAAKAPGQIAKGMVPSIVTNHINPIITSTVEQATNRDLTKPVAGPEAGANDLSTNPGVSAKVDGKTISLNGRGSEAANRLFGPAQTGSKVTEGKQTPTEAALGYGLGMYTPHTAGNQAAPNIKSGILARINKPGAKPGTGEAEAQAYYKAYDAARGSLQPGDQKFFDAYIASDKNAQGQTIQRDPSQSQSRASDLYSRDSVRQAYAKMQQAQSKHDPMWDLPDSKLKTFLAFQKAPSGGAEATAAKQQNPWIQQLENQRNAYYSGSQTAGNTVPSQFAKDNPYPLNAKEQNLVDQAASIKDPTEKAAFYTQNPQLTQAEQKLATYTNAERKNEGNPPLPSMPEPDTKTNAFMTSYLAANSATRAILRGANPTGYANMESYLTQSSVYSLMKSAAVDQLTGGKPDQTFLKDAYSLGHYDITTSKDANGKTIYALTDQQASKLTGGTTKNGISYDSSGKPLSGPAGGSSKGIYVAGKYQSRLSQGIKIGQTEERIFKMIGNQPKPPKNYSTLSAMKSGIKGKVTKSKVGAVSVGKLSIPKLKA